METISLSPNSCMTVEGVRYSDWIPPLHAYGPLHKCTIKVSDIVNLLNNDIDVVLRDDQNWNLYVFVKQHNEFAKLNQGYDPTLRIAARAEEVLYKRVYGKALEIEKENDRDNPFSETEDNEDLNVAAEVISNRSTSKSGGMIDPLKDLKNKKLKRGHAYDIFTGDQKSFKRNVEDVNEMMQYGDIDFDI